MSVEGETKMKGLKRVMESFRPCLCDLTVKYFNLGQKMRTFGNQNALVSQIFQYPYC